MSDSSAQVITVTLNPCLDWTVQIEQLLADDISRVRAHRVEPGGKGFNVGRYLHALGVPARNLVVLAGPAGNRFQAEAHAMDLALDVVEVAGETRTNINVMESSSGRQYRLNESGTTLSKADLEGIETRLGEISAAAEWVIFSGSLPPGAPDDTYARLIETVRKNGSLTALDADGPALSAGMQAQPDLAKPNCHELTRLTGCGATDPEAQLTASRALASSGGIGELVVSRGAQGAWSLNMDGAWNVAAPAIAPVSTVGLGDALLAGLIHGSIRDWPQPKRLEHAVAVAAATALTEGVAPARAQDIQRLADETHVTRM